MYFNIAVNSMMLMSNYYRRYTRALLIVVIRLTRAFIVWQLISTSLVHYDRWSKAYPRDSYCDKFLITEKYPPEINRLDKPRGFPSSDEWRGNYIGRSRNEKQKETKRKKKREIRGETTRSATWILQALLLFTRRSRWLPLFRNTGRFIKCNQARHQNGNRFSRRDVWNTGRHAAACRSTHWFRSRCVNAVAAAQPSSRSVARVTVMNCIHSQRVRKMRVIALNKRAKCRCLSLRSRYALLVEFDEFDNANEKIEKILSSSEFHVEFGYTSYQFSVRVFVTYQDISLRSTRKKMNPLREYRSALTMQSRR